MSLDSILAHKFRSALTILGIVIGIITAIVVASILTGMRQSIVSIVEDYGTNNIYAFHLTTGFSHSGNRDERNRKPLTEDGYIILSVGVSSLIGVVAGLYPAWKAARLDPIVALTKS